MPLPGLNLNLDKAIEGIAGAIDRFVTTPEEKQKLRQALDQELHRHLEAMHKAVLNDVASARSREESLRNTVGIWVQNLAAVFVLLLFCCLLVLLWVQPLAPENQRLADLLLGSLSGVVLQLFNYWFGASVRK